MMEAIKGARPEWHCSDFIGTRADFGLGLDFLLTSPSKVDLSVISKP